MSGLLRSARRRRARNDTGGGDIFDICSEKIVNAILRIFSFPIALKYYLIHWQDDILQGQFVARLSVGCF